VSYITFNEDKHNLTLFQGPFKRKRHIFVHKKVIYLQKKLKLNSGRNNGYKIMAQCHG